MIYKLFKYVIEHKELNIVYQDSGPLRSYELFTRGNNFNELLVNASVSAIDQDGGEMYTLRLEDYEEAIYKAAIRVIVGKLSEDKSYSKEILELLYY